MVIVTTLGVDAIGGAGVEATGEGEVGDEPRPQAADKARITTPNESFVIINLSTPSGPKTRPVITSAYC